MDQLTHCPLCRSEVFRPFERHRKHHLVKCSSCSFVFITAIPSAEELHNLYCDYSYGEDQFVSPVTLKRYKEILEGFEPYRKHNRLLDVGCGNGQLLSVARQMGWECLGLEVSPKAVEVCRLQGLTVLEGTLAERIEQLPQCDVVVSVEVLEHLNTPGKELAMMHDILRPGGLLYLTTPNFNGLLRLITGQDYALIGYPEHLCYFTPATLRLLVRNTGFELKKMESTGFSITGLEGLKAARFHEPAAHHSTDEKLRKEMEVNPVLGFFKWTSNFFLKLSGTGNSLKIWAVKPSKE